MTHYYIRNRQLGTLWTNEDGSLRLFGEPLKRATIEFMDAYKLNHIEFIPKEEYEQEIAALEYKQRLIGTYYGGVNVND